MVRGYWVIIVLFFSDGGCYCLKLSGVPIMSIKFFFLAFLMVFISFKESSYSCWDLRVWSSNCGHSDSGSFRNERRNTQSSRSFGAVPLVCEGVCILTIRFDVEEILSFDCFLDSSKSYGYKRSEFSRWSLSAKTKWFENPAKESYRSL